MMLLFLSLLLFLIFFGISFIHFYWVFGGKWGLSAALPTKDGQSEPVNPGIVLTLLVAMGLLMFGVFVGAFGGVFPGVLDILPSFISTYGMWIISSIFLIRAIGEFNYVGFFKKIKHTNFAKWDTKLFSPLCLLISILGVLIIFLA